MLIVLTKDGKRLQLYGCVRTICLHFTNSSSKINLSSEGSYVDLACTEELKVFLKQVAARPLLMGYLVIYQTIKVRDTFG